MADAVDLIGLFDKLTSASDGEHGGEGGSEAGGFFDGIDPETLISVMDIIGKLGEKDKNTELLTALRPLLREENRPKVDRAITLMRLMSIIPLLRDSGLAENLFK